MKENKKNISFNDENATVNPEDDICDLDPNKTCDDCMECLGINNSDYRIVQIDGVSSDINEVEEYDLENETLTNDPYHELNDTFDVEYIEDLPKLKEEYDKRIDELLGRDKWSPEVYSGFFYFKGLPLIRKVNTLDRHHVATFY